MTDTTGLLAAIELLADAVADRVAAKIRDAAGDGWIDQHSSPLGARKHCALVRSLVASGDHRAARIGRRALLTRDALAEAMVTTSNAAPRRTSPLRESVEQRLSRKLRLVGGQP